MKTMRSLPIVVISTILTTSPAMADKPTAKEIRGAGAFTGSAAIGALAGGPVGMVLGAIIGGLTYEQHEQKKEFKNTLALQKKEIEKMSQFTEEKEKNIADLESRISQKLEFQVLFQTGSDDLNEQDMTRLESLANYLTKNPKLNVRLDGHADPRGSDEYNNVLSAERAKNVANTLIELGMEENRIKLYSHGSSFTSDKVKNSDELALERRVHIEVFSKPEEDLASSN